jgi:ABC-type multidrug transport system permease subunit
MSVLFPLMMIGGNFFPLEAMPDWMARIGRFTPNGWSMQQLKSILLETVRPADLLVTFLALVVMWAILFFLNVRRIRTGFARG